MRFLSGLYGLVWSWKDGLTSIFVNVFLLSKASSANAIMAYLGTMYPTGMAFKQSMLKDAVGNRLLNEKTCRLGKRLSNHDYLKTLPDGSLGKAYHDFVTSEIEAQYDGTSYADYHKIKRAIFFSPNEIRKRELLSGLFPKQNRKLAKADMKTTVRLSEQIALQHDVMHVLLGYHADSNGEIGVHVAQMPHVKLPAVPLIGILGTLSQTLRTFNLKAIKIALEAYDIGKRANNSLFMVDWAEELENNLFDIRKRYNINDNVYYRQVG